MDLFFLIIGVLLFLFNMIGIIRANNAVSLILSLIGMAASIYLIWSGAAGLNA